MADYSVYGYSGFELYTGGVVQKRIVFAVSMARNPSWLAWYLFYEGLQDQDAFKLTQDAYNQDMVYHHTNVFGTMITGGHPQTLSFNPQIQVNAFAGDPRDDTDHVTGARLALIDRKTVYDCLIIADVPLSGKKTPHVIFDFDFNRESDLKKNSDGWGKLLLLGSVQFSKTAVNDGPPFMHAKDGYESDDSPTSLP